MATQELIDSTFEWKCNCGQRLVVTPVVGNNSYTCVRCGKEWKFKVNDEPDNVATQATDWLEKWLDMFKQPDDESTYTMHWDWDKVTELREEDNTLYDVWLRNTEAKEAADSILRDAPFVNSIADGTCDCSYCRAIREAKIKEQANKEAVKKHREELDKAVDLLLSFDTEEPTHFKGLNFKLEPVDPDLDTEAVRKWLRDCEKEIAKELNMSEAWVHVSINGEFLC